MQGGSGSGPGRGEAWQQRGHRRSAAPPRWRRAAGSSPPPAQRRGRRAIGAQLPRRARGRIFTLGTHLRCTSVNTPGRYFAAGGHVKIRGADSRFATCPAHDNQLLHTEFIHVISSLLPTILHNIVGQITKNKFPAQK